MEIIELAVKTGKEYGILGIIILVLLSILWKFFTSILNKLSDIEKDLNTILIVLNIMVKNNSDIIANLMNMLDRKTK